MLHLTRLPDPPTVPSTIFLTFWGCAAPVVTEAPLLWDSKMGVMAPLSSFDITSPVDFQEVDNALNQARKEVGQRYDFKDVKVEIVLNRTEKTLALAADSEFQAERLVGSCPDAAGSPWRPAEEFLRRSHRTRRRGHGSSRGHDSGGNSH